MTDTTEPPAPGVVDRLAYQAEIDALRKREKAHTREGDAISAARRRLPMVEVGGSAKLFGPDGPTTLLAAFEGRQLLIAYYFMWHEGETAADQCEGCTHFTTQIRALSHLHVRGVSYATIYQRPPGPPDRYHRFMDWEMPHYTAPRETLEALLGDRRIGMMHLVCYLRQGERVFETYWTWRRGVEAMDNTYRLLDLTLYGRQEPWEDSPPGWPQPREGGQNMREGERPISQWPRVNAGASDDLGPG